MLAEIQHERMGNFPRAWQISAENLLAASGALQERCAAPQFDNTLPSAVAQLTPIELMLRGLAVECLLKAVWLKQGNKLSAAGQFIRIPGAGSHDLNQISERAGVARDTYEADMLRRLTHFVQYAGRYPIPRHARDLRLTRSPSGGRAAATTWATPSDNNLFQTFVGRLNELIA